MSKIKQTKEQTKEVKEKRKEGAPQKFTPEQIQKIVDDFKKYIAKNEDPTIVWFVAKYPAIYSETLQRESYINKDYISDHKEFSELRKKAIAKQEAYLLKWATENRLNASVSIFRLKQPQHWYRDRSEVEHSWAIEGITITIDN